MDGYNRSARACAIALYIYVISTCIHKSLNLSQSLPPYFSFERVSEVVSDKEEELSLRRWNDDKSRRIKIIRKKFSPL